MTGKGHLTQGSQQTTIRTVVVSQQLVILQQGLYQLKEGFQLCPVLHIGTGITQLVVHLGQGRGAQTIAAVAQVNQQQAGIRLLL